MRQAAFSLHSYALLASGDWGFGWLCLLHPPPPPPPALLTAVPPHYLPCPVMPPPSGNNVCSRTFEMEDEWGRARAMRQNVDTPAKLQEAIDTCPVSCIHW